MVKFVDVPLDAGDPNRAVAELTAGVAESSNQRRQETTQTQDTRTVQQPTLDPKFAGKSIEDVVNMYKNLESHAGRIANQLGETKQALNQTILQKRDNDIRQNGGQVSEPPKIQPTDLMVNPTEAIDRLVAYRLSGNTELSAVKQRIAELEAQLGQSQFQARHPDAQEETIDPAFQQWVTQTPLRQKLAHDAANGNPYAQDALLTEWKSSKPTAAVTKVQDRAQDLVRRTGLESNNTGSESGNSPSTKGSRLYKRADIIALRQRNPDKYEDPAFQRELMRAYAEDRVVD